MTATSKSRISAPQLELMKAWSEYLVDSVERSVLFWDVMRKRGNIFLENVAKGEPPVLIFGYDVLIDGRKLDRPCNYALMQIRPPEGLVIDPTKRPVVVVDPRAGQGPGVGGFKLDSEIGFALRAGHPVYFVGFYPEPVPGQTLVDIGLAESRFLEEVIRRHPGAGNKPFVIGNCQAGWAVAALAAVRPELTGPVALVGAPLSYWAGADSQNPMRYNGGIFGGTWPGNLLADLSGGIIDGAWFIQNFENLNPANALWEKSYDLYSRVDTDEQRFLDFERWWGGYYLMTKEELREITDNLFAGNRLAEGIKLPDGQKIDLKNITSPVVVFASWGDNITPPQQALNWIVDVYGHEDMIVVLGHVIVYLLAEDVGHLSIFVGGRVARKEHRELINVMDMLEELPPGLYEMVIEQRPKHDVPQDLDRDTYTVRFETRTVNDIRALNPDRRTEESLFSTIKQVSEINGQLYEWLCGPVARAMSNEATARLLRLLHPLRARQYLLSGLNPSLALLPVVAEQVRQHRHPASEDKVSICQNAINLAHTLGVALPKVAVLSAVETVNPKITATLEAAALCKMADRGQITGGLVDGPLAMDNAISKTAAEVKHIRSEVAGDADILVVPDLEAGNMLAKQLTFMANADAAGVVLGARVPIVLTSRSDNVQTRLASCAVGLLVAHARRTGLPGGGDIKVPDSRGER